MFHRDDVLHRFCHVGGEHGAEIGTAGGEEGAVCGDFYRADVEGDVAESAVLSKFVDEMEKLSAVFVAIDLERLCHRSTSGKFELV